VNENYFIISLMKVKINYLAMCLCCAVGAIAPDEKAVLDPGIQYHFPVYSLSGEVKYHGPLEKVEEILREFNFNRSKHRLKARIEVDENETHQLVVDSLLTKIPESIVYGYFTQKTEGSLYQLVNAGTNGFILFSKLKYGIWLRIPSAHGEELIGPDGQVKLTQLKYLINASFNLVPSEELIPNIQFILNGGDGGLPNSHLRGNCIGFNNAFGDNFSRSTTFFVSLSQEGWNRFNVKLMQHLEELPGNDKVKGKLARGIQGVLKQELKEYLLVSEGHYDPDMTKEVKCEFVRKIMNALIDCGIDELGAQSLDCSVTELSVDTSYLDDLYAKLGAASIEKPEPEPGLRGLLDSAESRLFTYDASMHAFAEIQSDLNS